MNRRHFVSTVTAATTTACAIPAFGQSNTRKLRVAIIGHTGRGDYGHGLDTVWQKLTNTGIVAVADANPAGLDKAKARLGVNSGFGDYRAMLAEVKADIVAICPRHADQHCEMIVAAAEAGARGIYVEKPLCRTPAEADEIAAACQKSGTKLAVAHRNRYHPVISVIERLIAEGGIGNLLEIRGRGKGDHRGGVEDLWVLGSHVLNLVHYFAGDPVSCSANLLENGVPVTKSDVREGAEGLGAFAGNELHARYQFRKGTKMLTAYFDSIANDGTRNAGFGLQLIGSEGIIAIQCDGNPFAYICPGNPFDPKLGSRSWVPISTKGIGQLETAGDRIAEVHDHSAAAADLIAAILEDRPPLCDLAQGAATVEMICAAFLSHSQEGKAVSFPLTERRNALHSFE
ncbi:Gfo/Idh/MocA family oxidoreductase [Verrucomicrobiaceae bacterium 227]